MSAVLVLVTVVVFVHAGNAAKILCISTFPTYSHQAAFQPIWRELSLRGHQVMTITTAPINDPKLTNLTEIDLRSTLKMWNPTDQIVEYKKNAFTGVMKLLTQLTDVEDIQLRDPHVRKLLESDQKFDLIVIEAYMPAMFAFVAKFQCPFITLVSLDAQTYVYNTIGNPTHPVAYPDILLQHNIPMTFFQRLQGVLSGLLFSWMFAYSYTLNDQIVKEHFGLGYPPIETIMKNTSMLFVNTDFVFHQIRPLIRTVIQFGGGTHLSAPKPLPHDLKTKLDSAKNGFVYVSLGSNMQSKDIPASIRTTMLETFSELPYTILWKFEGDNLPNKSDNVIVSKWFPQQDVLRHRYIKLFITQGGLQSLDEAIYTGVPMVGLPFFGDQAVNIKKIVDKGMGLSLDYTTIKKGEFKEKIEEVIRNPKYRHRVKEMAALAQDQPMTGLDRAMWWCEYVIRHKGAAHLRSPLLDIPWYQYFLLDVFAVITFAVTFIVFILYVLIRLIFLVLRTNRDKKRK